MRSTEDYRCLIRSLHGDPLPCLVPSTQTRLGRILLLSRRLPVTLVATSGAQDRDLIIQNNVYSLQSPASASVAAKMLNVSIAEISGTLPIWTGPRPELW